MNTRYGPPPAIVGDELTIIGHALQHHLGDEIKRTVAAHAMFDEAIAAEPHIFDEQARKNIADSKERDWAWIARIDELRHKYIVEPVISVESYRENFTRLQGRRSL